MRQRPVVLAVLLAAAAGLAYLLIAPVSADLAAATFRADLFAEHGWLLWNNDWYGGHHLLAYSVLFPPLGALLGVRVVGVLAVSVAAGLFGLLLRPAFGARGAAAGALWFGLGVGLNVFTGRVPFLLGMAIGLGAAVAAQRERRPAAIGLAALAPLASPVVGAFVALGGVAWAIGARRRLGLALAAAGLAPVVVLNALFPEGGDEPFATSSFWPACAALVVLALTLPRAHSTLRAGAALYAAATLAVYVVPTPVGGNVVRLAALTAGPIVAAILWGGTRRDRALLAALALPLAYWQLLPAVRDSVLATGDPSTEAAYYAPLRAHLPHGTFRLEVPFTRVHWEAALLAPQVPLARGWERQLDRKRNALFYDGRALTPARYRRWLLSGGVQYVALPDVALDPSAIAEGRLVASGTAGLRELWRGRHWRLFAVEDARPIVGHPATLVAFGTDTLTLRFARPGRALVRIAFGPHWAVVGGAPGCVQEGPKRRLLVTAERAGELRLAQRFAPWRAVTAAKGARCST